MNTFETNSIEPTRLFTDNESLFPITVFGFIGCLLLILSTVVIYTLKKESKKGNFILSSPFFKISIYVIVCDYIFFLLNYLTSIVLLYEPASHGFIGQDTMYFRLAYYSGHVCNYFRYFMDLYFSLDRMVGFTLVGRNFMPKYGKRIFLILTFISLIIPLYTLANETKIENLIIHSKIIPTLVNHGLITKISLNLIIVEINNQIFSIGIFIPNMITTFKVLQKKSPTPKDHSAKIKFGLWALGLFCSQQFYNFVIIIAIYGSISDNENCIFLAMYLRPIAFTALCFYTIISLILLSTELKQSLARLYFIGPLFKIIIIKNKVGPLSQNSTTDTRFQTNLNLRQSQTAL